MALSRREFLKAVPVVATTSVLACATYPKRPEAPVLEEVDVIEAFDLEAEIEKEFIAGWEKAESVTFTSGSGVKGGYLVSEELSEEILEAILKIDPTRSITRARRLL